MISNGFISLLFWLFVAILVSVGYVWTLNIEEERTRQLVLWAKKLEFNFVPQIEIDDLRNSGLPLFLQGYDGRAFNVIKTKIEDLEIMIFDYRWRQPKLTVDQSVVCVCLAEQPLSIFQQGYSNKVVEKLFIREISNQGKSGSGVKLEMSKDYFIYYRPNKRVAPEKILGFWEEGVDTLNLFLDFASKRLVS